ncbi:MAG TPA: hypothetical protein VFI11_14945 [Anaerolineales bacterium]|nr:hypothetical protein [Anaerolineales bacterium]
MASSRDNTVLWIGGGLLVALVCCLCLALAVGGVSYWIVSRSVSTGDGPPTPSFETLEPGETQVPRQVTPVPPQARAMLEALSEEVVPIADPVSLTERLQGVKDIPRVLAEDADPIPLGTRQTFWATDVDTDENFQLQARLAYATDHVYFWIEDGVEYDQGELEALVDEFEQETYPTNREFFGSEWSPGVDGDPHLYILYANGLGYSIAGYYSSNDEYSPLAHEFSNGHEMFYLMAENVGLASSFTSGVLAHEFQHMIHWYRDRNEETWMNEGFSEVAAFINGYDVGGADYEYAADPDQTLTFWPSEPGTAGAHYGQSFLLLGYFLDRFGPDATKALIAHEANGLDSMDQALLELGSLDPLTDEPITADDVFADWALAMLLQDPSVGDGRYSFESYTAAPEPSISETVTECPGRTGSRSVSQYGVDYIRFDCSGDYTLTFEGTNLVPVLPAEAHSGDYAFWSNKGDESNMLLTRSFDLTDVEGPISLDYWLWYDIEEDYDYLYLEASTDGGETWTILTTPSGTGEDPTGNSYGWGYNGFSGGEAPSQWIEESVDLSDFAGEEVLLRFEYVTDAAVNGEGLLLDDIRLEAIGYEEDFENSDGGWEGEGFIRLYNRLPQSYRVLVVEYGDETRVRPMELGADQIGRMDISIGGEVDEVVLVVIGTTRHTWQPAEYYFGLTR